MVCVCVCVGSGGGACDEAERGGASDGERTETPEQPD